MVVLPAPEGAENKMLFPVIFVVFILLSISHIVLCRPAERSRVRLSEVEAL